MARSGVTHQTKLQVIGFDSQEVDVGTEIPLQFEVSCSSGCDLRGAAVFVAATGEPVATAHLCVHDGDGNRSDVFALKAPDRVGEHSWTITFPETDSEEAVHDECTVTLTVAVRPHGCSIAVWDVPAPVVVGSRFGVKVGVKCSVDCKLSGRVVEVRDEAGRQVGQGQLSETPWQETSALYWADVSLVAPPAGHVTSWDAVFPPDPAALPHQEPSARFSFRLVPPPDCRVTLNLVDSSTQTPIGDAEVRLGIYSTSTDDSGSAVFDVPEGTYELSVRRDGYEAPATVLEVKADLSAQVALIRGLTKAEWEDKLQEFKHIPWG